MDGQFKKVVAGGMIVAMSLGVGTHLAYCGSAVKLEELCRVQDIDRPEVHTELQSSGETIAESRRFNVATTST